MRIELGDDVIGPNGVKYEVIYFDGKKPKYVILYNSEVSEDTPNLIRCLLREIIYTASWYKLDEEKYCE